MILPIGHKNGNARRLDGFTLVELILVMAMLVIVLSVAFPSLTGFFRGRNLDSEARRFLSLTRYGQSRAVSEGTPMVLWIDARQRAYGLEAQPGYSDADDRAVVFDLHEDLDVEVEASVAGRQLNVPNQSIEGIGKIPMIRFLPDGFIGETSPENIQFRQGADDAIWITQSANRLNYEIQGDHAPTSRR